MGEVDRQRISAVQTLASLGYTHRAGEGWQLPQGSDRQRISAVQTLESLGYTHRAGEGWQLPQGSEPWFEADALYDLLLKQADRLCCIDDPQEDAQFWDIVRALEAYEEKRWPNGREPDGSG